MIAEKVTPEPSMDEILASIRKLIANDSNHQNTPPQDANNEEDVLDLTHCLPEETPQETCSSSAKIEEQKRASDEKKAMRLPLWAENIKTPFPFSQQKETSQENPLGNNRDDNLLISQSAASETAQALRTLAQLAQEKHQLSTSSLGGGIDGQLIEHQLREILKPLLKEWLDSNLPLLTRWVVSEQVEKIVQQYGLTSLTQKK